MRYTLIINNTVIKPLMVHYTPPEERYLTTFGERTLFHRPQSYTLSISVSSDAYNDNTLKLLLHTLNDDRNLYALGNGKICKYCGHYNPVGKLKCHRCYGELAIKELVRPQKLDIYVSSLESETTYNAKHIITFDLLSYNPDVFKLLLSNKLYTLQSNFAMFPNYYMCAYCGTIIENGKDCPNCGGIRIPLHEVMDIKRECIYCGNTTHGELVCNRCGAHIEAQILNDVI